MTKIGGGHGRAVPAVAALAVVAALAALPAAAQTPAEELDAAWVAVCAGATPGTSFGDRCDEILNAGPGQGNRRSEAALGNNLGTVGAQGRLSDERSEGERVTFDLGRWSLFATAMAAATDRKATDFEAGFEADDVGALLGADFRVNDRTSLGALVQFLRTDTDFDDGAGSLDVDSASATVFVNAFTSETSALSAYVGYGSSSFDSVRAIDYDLVLNAGLPGEQTISIAGTALGDTDGTTAAAGIAWSAALSRDALAYGPEIRVDYASTSIDGYAETDDVGLALRYDDQSIRSLTAQAGYQVGRTFSTGFGVVTPSIRGAYVYEFDDDPREIASSFVGDSGGSTVVIRTEDPDRSYIHLGVSLSFVLKGGTAVFVDYDRLLSHRFLDRDQVSVGVRFDL